MKLRSNKKRGANGLPYPMKCVVCGKLVLYTSHTIHGHIPISDGHTNEELENYVNTNKNEGSTVSSFLNDLFRTTKHTVRKATPEETRTCSCAAPCPRPAKYVVECNNDRRDKIYYCEEHKPD